MNRADFNKYKLPEPTKSAAYEFQDRVLKMLDYFDCPPNKKSCVFKMVRNNRSKAEAIFNYMQARQIKNVYYFFKCYGQK